MKIPLASIGLRQKDIEAATRVLNSNQLTMGQVVKEFERDMAGYLQVKHFIMVNSGSSANLAILEALLRPSIGNARLLPGDGVLVPSVAWPTTIWPIIQLGLKPIFVDVDLETIAMDLNLAERAVAENSNVKAIFMIHPLGLGVKGKVLDDFCSKFNLLQINDVCESLGSWSDGIHAGTSGIAGTFSFYFSHHITTMEGGGVATNDDLIADDIRAIRSHGWSRDRYDVSNWRNQQDSSLLTQSISRNQLKFQFITTGFNIRPMEIQAAIGLEQLKDLTSFVNKRRDIAKAVKNSLKNTVFRVVDADTLGNTESESNHSWMLIPIKINSIMTTKHRELLDSMLEEMEIESRPVLTGNFLRQPAIRHLINAPQPNTFKNAELISTNYFMVGCHQDLSTDQISYLGKSLNKIASEMLLI